MSSANDKQRGLFRHDGRHTLCPVGIAVVNQLVHLVGSGIAGGVKLLVHYVEQRLDVLRIISLSHTLGKRGIVVGVVEEAVELSHLALKRSTEQYAHLKFHSLQTAYRLVVVLCLYLEVLVDGVGRVEFAHVCRHILQHIQLRKECGRREASHLSAHYRVVQVNPHILLQQRVELLVLVGVEHSLQRLALRQHHVCLHGTQRVGIGHVVPFQFAVHLVGVVESSMYSSHFFYKRRIGNMESSEHIRGLFQVLARNAVQQLGVGCQGADKRQQNDRKHFFHIIYC